MLTEIGKELGAALRDVGAPLSVISGPERTRTTTYARERIVLEHDETAGDSFAAVRSTHRRPSSRFTRSVGAKLTIYAQSSAAGSSEYEHRRRAEHALDVVLVALDDVIRTRRTTWAITGGGFIQPADLAKSETIGGAVYELRFTVDRSVEARTWTGSGPLTTTLGAGSMKSTTRVSLANGPGADDDGDGVPDDAETSCGG